MRVTLNNINIRIADLGYELIRGDGYYYFFPLSLDTPELYDSFVPLMRLSRRSVEKWREDLVYRINKERPEEAVS